MTKPLLPELERTNLSEPVMSAGVRHSTESKTEDGSPLPGASPLLQPIAGENTVTKGEMPIPWNGMARPEKSTVPPRILGIHRLLGRPTPYWKRTMDIVGASVGLVLLSPVFIATAALIKTVSPGPVFYTQRRVGYRRKLFNIMKFRTMRVNADTGIHQTHVQQFIRSKPNAAMQKLSNDPRIIPMGKFLRKTAIDELPQLINVLKGDMSMVGPRPELPYAAKSYAPWPTVRFDVVPGMTGLWQVSGKNRTTYLEMMRLDVRYVLRRSFFLDLKILLKTFPVIWQQVVDKSARS